MNWIRKPIQKNFVAADLKLNIEVSPDWLNSTMVMFMSDQTGKESLSTSTHSFRVNTPTEKPAIHKKSM